MAFPDQVEEVGEYLRLLDVTEDGSDRSPGASEREQLMNTPLFSYFFKHSVSRPPPEGQNIQYSQYALLGQHLPTPGTGSLTPSDRPILLNTDAPWSAFICGLQGSGKSHTLACMLESCLIESRSHGKLPVPMAGVIFHCDIHSAFSPCEAAFLASQIRVNVLVSPNSIWDMKKVYAKVPGWGENLNVYPLLLRDDHLNARRMKSLMAVDEKEGAQPLYMQVLKMEKPIQPPILTAFQTITRILRELAVERQTTTTMDYESFKWRLNDEDSLTDGQKRPMTQRLQLLESFLETHSNKKLKPMKAKFDVFDPAAASLTIVDLSDPLVDESFACVLFEICLALFLQGEIVRGRVVALDEAHKVSLEIPLETSKNGRCHCSRFSSRFLYRTSFFVNVDRRLTFTLTKFMGKSTGSEELSQSLQRVIREQRHIGARVVIATQEPTIAPELLGLCNMTFVHGFSSPAWFEVLQHQLAAASPIGRDDAEDVKKIFDEITRLNVGQALLFCNHAMVRRSGDENDADEIGRLGRKFLKFKTRNRMTNDGGKSVMATKRS